MGYRNEAMARNVLMNTAQKIKISVKDFFSKCDQIHGGFTSD